MNLVNNPAQHVEKVFMFRLPTSEAPEARCPTKLAAVETLFSQAQPAKGEHQKSV